MTGNKTRKEKVIMHELAYALTRIVAFVSLKKKLLMFKKTETNIIIAVKSNNIACFPVIF
jgi:hypothetical protein